MDSVNTTMNVSERGGAPKICIEFKVVYTNLLVSLSDCYLKNSTDLQIVRRQCCPSSCSSVPCESCANAKQDTRQQNALQNREFLWNCKVSLCGGKHCFHHLQAHLICGASKVCKNIKTKEKFYSYFWEIFHCMDKINAKYRRNRGRSLQPTLMSHFAPQCKWACSKRALLVRAPSTCLR